MSSQSINLCVSYMMQHTDMDQQYPPQRSAPLPVAVRGAAHNGGVTGEHLSVASPRVESAVEGVGG